MKLLTFLLHFTFKLVSFEIFQQRIMQEVFTILKDNGANLATLGSAAAFGDALHTFAAQEHVRNGIWDACVSNLQ